MFFDIGANLTDPQFQGIYRNRALHPPDLPDILERAQQDGVRKIIVTVGSLKELEQAIELCDRYDQKGGFLYTTVGVHPTNCNDLRDSPEAYLKEMIHLAKKRLDRVIAIGELGLDFDRTHYCDIAMQKRGFEMQLQHLLPALNLPLFLHMRNAFPCFREILEPYYTAHGKGVVHSFTGNAAESQALLHMGLDIGLNGCSLKEEENLRLVRTLPLDRVHFETDAPWCSIRPMHASWRLTSPTAYVYKKPGAWEKGCCVKGRNEPCTISQVAEAFIRLRSENLESFETITSKIFTNSLNLFFQGNPNVPNDHEFM